MGKTTIARHAVLCARALACLALATSSAIAAVVTASDGHLDPTFGAGGLVYLGWDADPNVTPYDVAIAVLAPSDGSVIVVGNGTDAGVNYGSYSAICIAKLTPAGTFDTSFGTITTLGQTKIHGDGATYQIAATSAALQADGKIVIAGNVLYASGKQEAAVWRLNADGTPDTNFGFLGATFIDRGMPDQFDSASGVLVVQGTNSSLDGRIVVAGSFDFDPSLVISEPWIVQLDAFGLPVGNDANSLGSNTFDWPECNDGYHNLTFSAIRMAVRADTGALTYFLAGNCIPRNSGGTFPYHVPFIAAIDSTLHLVSAFGNNDVGISTVANHDSTGSIVLSSDSTITGLDVDADGSRIVYAGNWTADYGAFGTESRAYAGALDAHTGQFDQGWGYAGAGDAGFGGNSNRAWGILVDHTRGGHASAIVGGVDGCVPSPILCQSNPGQSFAAKKLGEGVTLPYCGLFGQCEYQYPGETGQGAYAMAYTQGAKVLLAGYVLIGPRADFAVMRLQGGDVIFQDGFGAVSQYFQ